MIDNSTVIGWAGTFAVVSVGQWNDVIACVCGVTTTAYMLVKLIETLRKKK